MGCYVTEFIRFVGESNCPTLRYAVEDRVSLRDIVTQQFQMTPAGTPPLIHIQVARAKAASCMAQTLEEACKRRCPLCRDGAPAWPTNSTWWHGKDSCEASDLRNLLSELTEAEAEFGTSKARPSPYNTPLVKKAG